MYPFYMNTKDKFGKRFNNVDKWIEFYGDLKEEVPDNTPEEMGKGVRIIGYVEANHAGY